MTKTSLAFPSETGYFKLFAVKTPTTTVFPLVSQYGPPVESLSGVTEPSATSVIPIELPNITPEKVNPANGATENTILLPLIV